LKKVRWSSIPSQEEINEQQELLKIHCNNLAHYLRQQASLGRDHIPPGIANGLYEERNNISRIKSTLRGWGVSVTDYLDGVIVDQSSSTEQMLSGDIIIEPINATGSNKRVRSLREEHFTVQINFHIKASMDCEILNCDFEYNDSEYLTIAQYIFIDGEEVKLNYYAKLDKRILITRGYIKHITLIKRFPLKPHVDDYGNVLISIDVSFLKNLDITHKKWNFKLAPGGELLPVTDNPLS
jgi:hypothetical protein